MKTLLLATFLYAQVTAGTPGIVTGRILTADGLSAASVRVSVTPVPDSSTQNAATPPLLNLVETDQSGNFRIEGVIPGRYQVVAGFVEFPTFYPGVRERAAATIVNVTAGAIVSGINFQVAPISTGLKVSGSRFGAELGRFDRSIACYGFTQRHQHSGRRGCRGRVIRIFPGSSRTLCCPHFLTARKRRILLGHH